MYQNNGNILFISDDEQLQSRFRQAYVSSYNIFSATSIREAYQILKDFDMHLVLVQRMMPEMSGLQFCESISHEFPDLVSIILYKGNDTTSLENAYQANQIFSFIKVPYSQMELKMTVDNALRLQQASAKNKQLEHRIEDYQKEQKDILDLFKRYVPGEVVSQALNTSKEDIMKPGESRVVSVLFADIRNFTKLTSHLPPSQVVQFLNDYWNIVSAAIRENKGSVNKYMGDGLLAVFGAPVSYIDNHENAIYAALDMIESLKEINRQYAEILGSEISIGIGINSGDVVVGNIGTDDYMEYTVIGNTVNTASRLETISKDKSNSIIISDKTQELVKHAFRTTDLQETRLSDKDEIITYCEVLGPKSGNVFPLRSQGTAQ